ASVVDNQDGTHTITVTDGNGQTSTTTVRNGVDGKDGVAGKDGKDGTSATATVTNNNDGTHTISVTDATGTTTTTVRDGAKGEKGDMGANGRDGVDGKDGTSATATVTNNNDGTHTISVTDATGTTTTIVRDGKDGVNGKDGAPGTPGGSQDIKIIPGTYVNDVARVESADEITFTVNVNGTTVEAGKNMVVNSKQGEGNTTVYTVETGDSIVVGEPGKDGKDGKDGFIGVNGKDGASVAINGKDGSIGLTGPKGADGKDGASATINVKDGQPGVNGKDGETLTRIVYTPVDPDGNPKTPEEVATLSDGLKFVGNDTDKVIEKKLNETLRILGGLAQSEGASEKNIRVDVVNGELVIKISEKPNFEQVTTGDTSISNDGLVINNGPKVTKDGVDAGDKQITNVKDGDITVDSKDAVNGSQLYETNQGWTVTTSGNTDTKVTSRVKLGKSATQAENTVTFEGGKNIKINQVGNNISVATVENPTFTSVTVGGDNGVKVSSSTAKDGVKELSVGSKGAETRITNVAPGIKDTDAVNVSQLKQVQGDINNVNNKVDKLDKRVRGIGASSAAASSLPQVMSAGKSMVSAAAGGYAGASAVAVGYSRASDNGKVVLKLQGTANSQGHISGGVGVGYQW
ncbi:hypothetical protein C5N92_06770, partial [Glaesserella australis]